MAKRTGADLALTIATVAIAAMRSWSLEDQDVNVDTTAAGDAMVDRESTRGDYTLEWESLLAIATPYVLTGNVRGTKVAWAAKVVAADLNGIVASTGLVDRFRIAAAYDGVVSIQGTIRASATPLTYDTSPAS